MINPTTHAITEFTPPAAKSNYAGLGGIAAGSDGNLWFTEDNIDANISNIGMINPTTHAIAEFPTPTPNASPNSITAGPDGNLWFTESIGAIGMINPTTHAITDFPIPTGDAHPNAIAAGPDGNLWFTDIIGAIGMINPTTHAITEFPLPISAPLGIVGGPDGNLWFTDGLNIGSINPTTHAIVETSFPDLPAGRFLTNSPYGITSGPDGNLWFTAGNYVGSINPTSRDIDFMEMPDVAPQSTDGLEGITTGPDGNLWFTESSDSRIAVLTPGLSPYATAEPPTTAATGQPFGLTVTVDDPSGQVDSNYNGTVTLTLLPNLSYLATLGGTLTVMAQNGVANFTGLTLDQTGTGFQIVATTDDQTSTATTPIAIVQSTPVAVAKPTTIVAEQVLYAGKGRHRHVDGFELVISSALDSTRAVDIADQRTPDPDHEARPQADREAGALPRRLRCVVRQRNPHADRQAEVRPWG